MGGRRGGAVVSRMSRRRLFRALLFTARGPVLPPMNKDNTAPCRGCLLSTRNPSSARAEAVPGTFLATMMSARGEGYAQKSKQSLPSFSRSKLSRHLRPVESKRAEAMEGLL